MFVDSADWVMGPNVYGMGQFSDGGIFATKPYISGSNYILKMSDYKKGEWCDIWDGLFWRFIGKHSEFFAKQYRLSFMVVTLNKMDKAKKERLLAAAEEFLSSKTRS
jgi:deoxyribodipyrimidine photolyase-related protein